MQLLAYTESRYSSNLIRIFVSVLDQCDPNAESCEATVIFNEQSTIGWSSPVVVTIKSSADSGLVISSQRFYKAGSRNNGRNLFIQIQKDIEPSIIAIARDNLRVAQELQDILPTDEELVPENNLIGQLRSRLEQDFCFYLRENLVVAPKKIERIPERRRNYSGSRSMSDHSIIQFIK